MTKAVPPGSPAGTPAEGSPSGVAVASGGQWGFVSLGSAVGVLRLSAGRPADLAYWINLPEETAGVALTPDGRYLLLAGGSGAVVVSVPAAEQGRSQAVLGELAARGQSASASQVAVSPDSRYAFVSLEYGDEIAVFDLTAAVADGFSGDDGYVGAVPTQVGPVGLAVSPDGQWLYSTSEAQHPGTLAGSLAVISVPRAESDPAIASVVATVPAGCEPVRVISSADGSVVWVTARASDALLAFSASRLHTYPGHALLADVRVGEAPVGLALAGHGLMVVADSNRFGATGKSASLAVLDVRAALTGRRALVGYLPAGQFPRDMAASPDGSTVLVANYDSGQIETVNGAALP
jgi:DNA-binding beta-propeller fold protein YncE